jgi:hypothetical protein
MPARLWVGVAGLLALVVALGLAFLAIADLPRTDPEPGPAYVAIEDVPRQDPPPIAGPDASTGSFSSHCGHNENRHRNRDNLVTAPGERGGAHHLHEYVGNVSTNAFSTDTSLSAAATTCSNGDLSSYYWPVLRMRSGADTHHGTVIDATSVTIRYRGNPTSAVVPMPRFLRAIAGDPQAGTSDSPVAVARWACTGSVDRQTPLYPLCPPGELVVRTFDFPGCWDGRRIDSPDHRAHVAFAAHDGSCPHDTFPIPQLRVRASYEVPAGETYVVDTFADQHGSPVTDHSDFVNVMPPSLMRQAVDCINSGRSC